MSKLAFIEGSVAFSNVVETAVFKGTDTGRFKITVTIDPEFVSQLEEAGVKLKSYEGTEQKAFSSKFQPEILDVDGNVMELDEELPRGTSVRVLYSTGPANPMHGVGVFVSKIKVLAMAEDAVAPEDF